MSGLTVAKAKFIGGGSKDSDSASGKEDDGDFNNTQDDFEDAEPNDNPIYGN